MEFLLLFPNKNVFEVLGLSIFLALCDFFNLPRLLYPDIEDKDGNTLLGLAVQANCFQIVDYLLNAGADLNISNVRIYLFF